MACFIIPGGEAVITTVAEKIVRAKEKNVETEVPKISLSTKLGWLNKLLFGGSALLAFEHVWHGEVSPIFPFLTAVREGETLSMLKEMGTAGVGMAVLVTAVWVGIVIISNAIENKKTEADDTKTVKADN